MKDNVLYFATNNVAKFREAKLLLSRYGIRLRMLRRKIAEPQSDYLSEIARAAVLEAMKYGKEPVFVEDAGLFIESLKGFPGPYSSFIFRTIGNEGILKLMEGMKNRKAEFRSAVAYCDSSIKPVIFQGVAKGTIAYRKKGKKGFGYDPIFIHKKAKGRTFGEMETEEKNELSHRAQALRRLAKWYRNVCLSRTKH